MIFHKKPVTLLQAISVDWDGLIFGGVGNDQRDELFRELERSEIICAAQNHGIEAEGIGVCGYKMFRGGLAGGIRAARIEG